MPSRPTFPDPLAPPPPSLGPVGLVCRVVRRQGALPAKCELETQKAESRLEAEGEKLNVT